MSEEHTGRIVRYRYDPANPPQLTAEQRDRLEAIRDEDIDLSDIPDQSGRTGWQRGILSDGPAGRLQREITGKKLLLVDSSIADYFEGAFEDAEGQMNAVLGKYVETRRGIAS